MDEYSDEYWESQGFRKIFIPHLNSFGWAKEMDFDMPVSEMNNIQAIETLLELCVENDEFEKAAELRDRLKELKAG